MSNKKENPSRSALRYLIYFTQFGIDIIVPPIALTYLAWWLKNRFGWGNEVVLAGTLLGVAVAVCSIRTFLRFIQKQAREGEEHAKNHDKGDSK